MDPMKVLFEPLVWITVRKTLHVFQQGCTVFANCAGLATRWAKCWASRESIEAERNAEHVKQITLNAAAYMAEATTR